MKNSTFLWCHVDQDCPSIGYRCYGVSFAPQGRCECAHVYAMYGSNCQNSTLYAKITSILIIPFYAYAFYLSVALFFENGVRRNISFSAFYTTSVQNLLALLTGSMKEFMFVYILFKPDADKFWLSSLFNYLMTATEIHGVGAAFNMAFMWIEISTFQHLYLIKNLKRTKFLLVFLMTALYIAWVYSAVVTGHFVIVQLIALCFEVGLLFSFQFGAVSMSRLLSLGLASNALTSTDATHQRDNLKRVEIRKILTTGRFFCGITLLGMIFMGIYMATKELGVAWLSFYSNMMVRLCMQCSQVALHLHLKGSSCSRVVSSLSSWKTQLKARLVVKVQVYAASEFQADK